MNNTAERWSTQRAQTWQAEHGWLVGCNFLPSTAINSTEMWQAQTFDLPTITRELDLARGLGFNSIRVFLQYLVWEDDARGFLHRFEQLLEAAHDRGITVLPILFDDCAFSNREPYLGPQDELRKGVHNGGWTSSPGFARADDLSTWPQLRQYVQAFVGQWGQDARVVGWDLYNEPGNSNRGDKSLPLLQKAFEWAREMSPSQPITSGVWSDQTIGCNRWMLEHSDVLSFHLYDSADKTQQAIHKYLSLGRPALCTEWMARGLNSTFHNSLSAFRDAHIGCYSWGLVNGKTQTHLVWAHLEGRPNSEKWFHDIFHADGTPYDAEEVAFIRRVTGDHKNQLTATTTP